MKTPKAPPPPDPVKTAQSQAGMNVSTGISQQLLNMTNQNTPDGSLSYDQTGSSSYVDPFGKTINIPRFTATQTLSPQGQQLHDVGQQSEINLATLGRDQSARLGGLLDRPISLGNEETEARLMDLGSRRLNPQFARDEDSMRTRLINQGIRQGSDAWNTEMDDFGQRKNDAMNQLLLGGRGQAIQEQLTERNQPLNEITALMSGSQVSQPNFVNGPQTSVAGTDYAGMVKNNYDAQVAQQQMKNSNQQALMGGLFGLAGTASSAAMGKGAFTSSRDYKTAGEDAGGVLDKIASMPVERWAYKPEMGLGQDHHIGPYAEDFRDAFGVGDGKTIAIVDMMGVLFKGLQELTQEVRSLKAGTA
jgi:hypothetical protein